MHERGAQVAARPAGGDLIRVRVGIRDRGGLGLGVGVRVRVRVGVRGKARVRVRGEAIGLGLGLGLGFDQQVETSVAYTIGSRRQQPTTTRASMAFIWVVV